MKNSTSPLLAYLHQRLAVVAAVGAHPHLPKVLAHPFDRSRQHFLGPVAGVPIAFPQPQIQHIAGLRQGPVQRAVAPRIVVRKVRPFLLLPIHFMDRRVPVQRRYLAPLSGQHPERFLLYCLRRVPQLRQSLPLLVLLVVTKAPQKLADRRGVRYPVAPQHSLQCVILAQPIDVLQLVPATEHAEDQGQDMIRFPVPLAAPQHSYPSVDSARHSEPLDQLAHQHQT